MWTQCLAVYMTVITDEEPDYTNNLLAYFYVMTKQVLSP